MKKIILRICLIIAINTSAYSLANASVIAGSIDSVTKTAFVCHDAACTSHGVVNFSPTIGLQTPGAQSILVADSGLTGNAWGSEIGWINLNPTGGGVSINSTTGALSGFAYASVGSWINFNPTGGGVTLVDTGAGSSFFGWAWVSGIYGGWLHFDCASTSTCVQTDWRALGYRTAISTSTSVSKHGGASSSGPTHSTTTEQVSSSTLSYPQPSVPVVPSGVMQPPPTTATEHLDNSNSFDQNGDGLPDKAQPPAVLRNKEQAGNAQPFRSEDTIREYDGVAFTTNDSAQYCYFCVVRRFDSFDIGGTRTRADRSIVKYGFVPQQFEVRLPLSEVPGVPLPDVDGTSVLTTAIAGWSVRRLIVFFARLFRL
jgi:hypothetical protein